MILVDTSVLIDYFKNNSNDAVSLLDDIIEKNIEFGICGFIYQEILQGAKTEREFNTLQEYLQDLPFYELQQGKISFEKTALLNFKCRRAGITIRSSMDLLIAQIAIENNLYLLHNDKDFTNLANVITELKIYH